MMKLMKLKKTNKKRTTSSEDISGGRREAARIEKRAQMRRKRQLKYLLVGIFLGLCICLLLFSVWKLMSIFLESHSGSSEYDKLAEQYVAEEPIDPADVDLADESGTATVGTRIDLAALQEQNSQAVGWIEIPDTEINYPLVHTSDNSYYLTHTFTGEKNKAGGIFVETSNNADFTDLHTIIYGHNMKNGSMFGGLKKYKEESYLQEHPYIYIDLADGAHCYQIFSAHEAETTDVTYSIGYAADSQYEEFLNSIKSASLYDTGVDVGAGDCVITLSTCSSDDSRFVVHAKKIY